MPRPDQKSQPSTKSRSRYSSVGPSNRKPTTGIVRIPTSTVLQDLLDHAPADQFTLRWLLERLSKRGFGIVIFLLALVGMVPGVCVLVAVLLLIPAAEMIAGRAGPTFPRGIADRPFPTRYLTSAVRRAVLPLRHFEKAIHPRWQIPPEITKRAVGVVVLLMAVLLATPVPMIQVVPASVIAAIALAYIEDDGLLLSIAFASAAAVLAVAFVAIWQMILGAEWIGRIW
jgi:hypothetical protein